MLFEAFILLRNHEKIKQREQGANMVQNFYGEQNYEIFEPLNWNSITIWGRCDLLGQCNGKVCVFLGSSYTVCHTVLEVQNSTSTNMSATDKYLWIPLDCQTDSNHRYQNWTTLLSSEKAQFVTLCPRRTHWTQN